MPLRALRTPAALVLLVGVAACSRAPGAERRATPEVLGARPWGLGVAPFTVADPSGLPYDLPFLGGFDHPRPQLVDIDGDGRLDLFVQEVTGPVLHFVQDGMRDGIPVWALASERFQDLDVGEWFRFADLDGDGDFDLLGEAPFSYVRYWRNDGTPQAPRFVLAADTLRDAGGHPIFSDRQNIPQLGDIDCDGVPDLLIGKLDGTVARYEMVAAAGGPPRFALLTEEFEGIRIIGQAGPGMPGGGSRLHGANTMALADHDGDGDLDLFWGDFFEPGLLLIENTGTCEAPNLRGRPGQFPARDPLITSGYNAPTFGDLDGDGGLDLVMGVLGGAFNPNLTSVDNLYLVAGPIPALDARPSALGGDSALGTRRSQWIVRSRRLVRMIDVGSESIPTLVDLDGDGDLDLLVANKLDPDSMSTSKIHHFENTGTPTEPSFRLRGTLPFGGRYHYAPAFGDLDGDGRLDLILGQWGAALAYHRGTADGFVLVDSAYITITRGSNTTPTLGDVDGDGDLDLFIGEASGALNYYRNDGTPSEPRFVLVSDTWEGIDVGRRSAPHLVDLDGDGDLDLLVGSELEGVWLFRNEGTVRAPRFVRDDTFHVDVAAIAAPAVGDLTGDGRLELLVGTVAGGLSFFSIR